MKTYSVKKVAEFLKTAPQEIRKAARSLDGRGLLMGRKIKGVWFFFDTDRLLMSTMFALIRSPRNVVVCEVAESMGLLSTQKRDSWHRRNLAMHRSNMGRGAYAVL